MLQELDLIGRLGRDPEMRYLPSGDPVTSFNIATDRVYNDKSGQKIKETTWFRISVFGQQAENANTYLSKGKLVYVKGRLSSDPATGGPRVYTGQDGTPKAGYDVVASDVRYLSPRDEKVGEAAGAEETDPIPF